MATTTVKVPIHSGFKGFIAGVVDADFKQRAYFELGIDGESKSSSSAMFEAQGKRVDMKDVSNKRAHWSFGPISKPGHILVKITHFNGSRELNSKMVGPLSIRKAPEQDYPMEFYKNTVISEDSYGDQSHDDCTLVVLEYK